MAASVSLIAAYSVWWFYRNGYILYYGDAQAHLNIARGIFDSRTPGYNQIGNVWLPLLHLLCVPLVRNDWLWSTGLAGSIPVAVCFLIAACSLYFAARDIYGQTLAAGVVVACLVLNPNMLYLASIPLTEQVFAAGIAVLLLAMVRFRHTQSRIYLMAGVIALWAMCMTRYDGWFLIPFAACWFGAYSEKRKLVVLAAIGAGAALAPIYWFGHCWWLTGNALDFYNGPYSALAIQGGKPYPGYHNWHDAVLYYADAVHLCAGWPLLLLGIAGCACAIATQRFSAAAFLWLTPLFYVWSIHSSGNPVYGPRYFHSYYNTRYACAAVISAAFSAGAIVLVLTMRRRWFAYAIPIVAALPWLVQPSREAWICWKESEVNSVARRAWTLGGANYLAGTYGRGEGILASAGDVAGVFCRARIPLAETLTDKNVPDWYAASTRPYLATHASWAIAQQGDLLSRSLEKEPRVYKLVQRIEVKGAPALDVYRRANDPIR